MKSAKTTVIVAVVVCLALCLVEDSAGRDAQTPATVTSTPVRAARTPPLVALPGGALRPPTRRVRPPEDPHKESVILLEAFMVEVRLSALHSQGVSQISQGPHFVTADHIIKLMKTTDAAVVTAGAKLAFGQGNKANTESIARQSVTVGPPDKKRTEYMDVGTSFTAMAQILRGGKISANLEFDHSGIEEGNVDADIKSALPVTRNWSSKLYLEPGKPTIVGAIQDKDTVAFLIVTANIKEK